MKKIILKLKYKYHFQMMKLSKNVYGHYFKCQEIRKALKKLQK